MVLHDVKVYDVRVKRLLHSYLSIVAVGGVCV